MNAPSSRDLSRARLPIPSTRPSTAGQPSLRRGATLVRPLVLALALTLGAFALSGCRPGSADGHAQARTPGDSHGHGHGGGDGHGHGHGESPSGASFKAGRGVMLTAETARILELATAEVTERPLPIIVPVTLQVFDKRHRHPPGSEDHSGCDAHGAGLIPTTEAARVAPGRAVEVTPTGPARLGGIVLAVQPAATLGESEVVVGISNAAGQLPAGTFIPARIVQPRPEPVTAIPASALLRTAEGTFVYTVNGDAYFRTAVQAGPAADGWVEITDGLLAGDQVVVHPPETLWLIELRATKGGAHCH